MYLYHYGLSKLPFSLTPDTELFCSLPNFKAALNTLHFALSSGEAICKIVGEVGTGKTMLCRWLIKQIGDQRTVAYIPNPTLSSQEFKLTLASELKIKIQSNTDESKIISKIQNKLIEMNKRSGPVVIVIDEAQALPEETLETIRLFTNLETETNKLVQIVLFGQPELDKKLSKNALRQIKQRMVFSHYLRGLTFAESKTYLHYRLARVAYCPNTYFTLCAQIALLYSAKGIPRVLNILAHKSLMLAFGAGKKKIRLKDVVMSVADTESTSNQIRQAKWSFIVIASFFISSSVYAWWIVS